MLLRNSPARQRPSLLRYRILDDFKNGMLGSERLKKDSVESIIYSQTNSPGAVQQVSVSNFSQQAYVQQQRSLGPSAASLGKR
jgi:hypothetical protein